MNKCVNFWLEEKHILYRTAFPFHTSTLPAIPPPASPPFASFITVCFVIIFLYTKPHFLLVEIDSRDDTKQFISPFIPCFVLIAPNTRTLLSASLCLERGMRGVGGRLIGCSANCQAVLKWQIWLWAAQKWYYRELCNVKWIAKPSPHHFLLNSWTHSF